MEGGDRVASALITAFNALIGVAQPNRVVPVLREALSMLLEEEASPAPGAAQTASKVRNRNAGDIESWTPLRERVLAELAERGLSRRALTGGLGIGTPRCARLFCPAAGRQWLTPS